MSATDRTVDSTGRCRIQDNTCRTSRPWLAYETSAEERLTPTGEAKPRTPTNLPDMPGPTYSALDLMGETYLALWSAGKIPDGPMRDPERAQRACAELLRAFGVTPSEAATTAESHRAAGAVAAVVR